MTLPAGVQTKTLTIGRPFDVLGNYATLAISVIPVFGGTAQRLLWSATGETLELRAVPPPTQTDPDGDPTETIDLPVVDQSGWLDGSGNAITNWSYQVAVQPVFPPIRTGATADKMKPYVKYVSPVASMSSPIDMDKLPDGTAAIPTLVGGPAITSIAGVPGSVVSAADLVAALAASGLIAPIVTHGTSTTVARPAGASVVIWYGTATPAHMAPQDIWTDAT